MRRIVGVLAIVVAVAGLAGCGGSGATGAPEASGLAAPEGTRWVGYDGVVVAVPDWWTTGETQCGAPVETTVYLDSGAVYDCADPADPATVREVSALAVLDGTSGYGAKLLGETGEAGSVRERPDCESWFEGVCRHVFALPGTEVVFAVTIADEGDGAYEAIRDSVRRLPDGVTTVPLAAAGVEGWTPTWGAEPPAVERLAAAIEAAGLTAVVEQLEPSDDGGDVADLPVGSLLDVQPALGSPIEAGGTVTLTVMGAT